MPRLQILSLTCVAKEDNNPRDEVSLYIDGNQVFGPASVAKGDVVVNGAIAGPHTFIDPLMQVELLEEDPNGTVDRLGSFTIPEATPQFHDFYGVFDRDFPDAVYYVEYNVLP